MRLRQRQVLSYLPVNYSFLNVKTWHHQLNVAENVCHQRSDMEPQNTNLLATIPRSYTCITPINARGWFENNRIQPRLSLSCGNMGSSFSSDVESLKPTWRYLVWARVPLDPLLQSLMSACLHDESHTTNTGLTSSLFYPKICWGGAAGEIFQICRSLHLLSQTRMTQTPKLHLPKNKNK